MIWKKFKTLIRKNIISQRNADKLAPIETWLSTNLNRGLRGTTRLFVGGESSVPQLRKFAVSGGHTFFGYYDVTPFSKNNERLLAMVAPSINRTPRSNDSLILGYFDIRSGDTFHRVAETTTWCWQQGCRLQWYPANENELIIFNRMVKGCYGSVILNVNANKEIREYGRSIYDIDNEGKWAISLNFTRLQRLRPGYGYVNLPEEAEGNLCPENDGIWLMDLHNGTFNMILSLAFLSRFEPLQSMEGAEHYVNHLSFNPSGNYFMFFHLWLKNGDSYNRLIVCKRDGSEPRVLEDQGNVSHYCWKSEWELLVTVNFRNKPYQYNLYHVLSSRHNTIGQDVLTVDGHPSYSPCRSLLLTDTYPDKYREQTLLLYTAGAGLTELGRFFLPFHLRGEVRCDLHPRWDRTGQYICFDSANDGKRALYVIDLKNSNASCEI